MNIMDFFRPASPAAPVANTPAPAPQPQPVQMPTPGNIPPQTAQTAQGMTDPTLAPNGIVPPGTNKTNPPSPLDAFNDLWNNPTNPDPAAVPAPLLSMDPAKVQEAARRVSFIQNAATEQQMAAIAAGGTEAVKAMMEVMNTVSQNAYAQAAMAATKITETALSRAQTQYDARLPDMIKRHTVSDSIRTNNPAFTHPAVAPIISALEQQLVVKYPTATAAELNAMARQYMEAAGSAFAPPTQQTQQQKQAAGETDWMGFMGVQ